MAFETAIRSTWPKVKDFFKARATRHICVAILALLQLALVVIVGWVYCSPGKDATIFEIKYEFSDMLQRRNALADLGSDLLSKVDTDSGNALSAAQAQASSVVQEASSAVTEISKAIAKPTLIANMTAEKACLEILSFSKCSSTKVVAGLFVAGFCLLACSAAATAFMFFCSIPGLARALGLFAIGSGIAAIVFLEGVALLALIIVEVVSSMLTDEELDSNARSIYLTFTCIAFFSVATCIIIIHQHRPSATCGECNKQSNSNSSRMSTNVSTSRGKPLSSDAFYEQFVPPNRHPARLQQSKHTNVVKLSEDEIPVTYRTHEGSAKSPG